MNIKIIRVSPLATIQDLGRFGHLEHGISASGPMDKNAFLRAGGVLSSCATSGIEFTQAGLDFIVQGGDIKAAFFGGNFSLFINQKNRQWNSDYHLKTGDEVLIKPGKWGNYGYVRFNAEINLEKLLNSRSTNMIVGLGGFNGRALKMGDIVDLLPAEKANPNPVKQTDYQDNVFHFIWGIHAEYFNQKTRNQLTEKPFFISTQLNRMGVRLLDKSKVFANEKILSLVSDPIVCGDIQILGDGTPIVLMRDHQPTGGYPRIGTIISTEIDRFAQMRPNSKIYLNSISIENIRGAK